MLVAAQIASMYVTCTLVIDMIMSKCEQAPPWRLGLGEINLVSCTMHGLVRVTSADMN